MARVQNLWIILPGFLAETHLLQEAQRWLAVEEVVAVVVAVVAAVVLLGGLALSRLAPAWGTERLFGPGPYELTAQARTLMHEYCKPGHLDQAIAALQRALSADQKYASAHATLADTGSRSAFISMQ